VASIFRRNGSPNLYVAYFDHTGRRREKSARTTERRVAERIASKVEEDVALTRAGVVDPRNAGYVAAGKLPVKRHVDDYLAHCRHVGQAARHLLNKRGHLTALLHTTRASRITDLDADAVGKHLRAIKASGRSPRTVNSHRATIIAWMNWLVSVGRIPENRLEGIPTLDERKDRRRERRALLDEELARLIGAAKERDEELLDDERGYCPRATIYLVAARTGLRRSEMAKLTWGDADLERAAVEIRVGVGKAARDDLIPLHPQVVRLLRDLRPAHPTATSRVFWTMPTIKTFYQDLDRARETWIAEAGSQEERERREKSDFLARRDSGGRWVDFHSLRKTFATALPRASIMPQLAKNLMRHADMRTTLEHYTDLRLTDLAAAISGVPDVEESYSRRRGKPAAG
jgi:integrase